MPRSWSAALVLASVLVLSNLFIVAVPASAADAEDFGLHDGDKVVFLGDSLTAARTYTKYVENYALLRYPERRITFVNSGYGGDTAHGGWERFQRDVLSHQPTVVFVMYGTNDIGWGLLADEAHRQKYLDAIRHMVKACVAQQVRIIICSEPVTAADPYQSEDSFLQKMCDAGMELSRSLGGEAIDVQRGMRAIQKRVWDYNQKIAQKDKQVAMHLADGAHLNDLGHLAAAFALLKGLHAPAEVSSCLVDAEQARIVSQSGCEISQIERTAEGVDFTRLDQGLPFNYGLFFALNFAFVPFVSELNQYTVAVQKLPEGRYDLVVDDRPVGAYAHSQLAAGVNIASATTSAWAPGGPWNARANALVYLTDSRHNLEVAGLLSRMHLAANDYGHQFTQAIGPTNDQLEDLQHEMVKPRPFRFHFQRQKPDDPPSSTPAAGAEKPKA